jgi:hypothetical protein
MKKFRNWLNEQAGVFSMLSLILLMFLFLQKCNGQPGCSKNPFNAGSIVYAGRMHKDATIYFIAQPVDKGGGFRLDYPVYMPLGAYVSATAFGNYWIMGTFGEIPHQKFSMGVIYYLNINQYIQPRFTLGGNYNSFIGNHWHVDNSQLMPYQSYLPSKSGHLSFEAGMAMRVGRWATVEYTYDFHRNESNAGFGVSF